MERCLFLPFSDAPDARHEAAPDHLYTISRLANGESVESFPRLPSSADPSVYNSSNAPEPPGALLPADRISAIAASKETRRDEESGCSAAGVACFVECDQRMIRPTQLWVTEDNDGVSLTWLERSAIWIGMKDAAAGHASFRPGSTWAARLYQSFRRWIARSSPLPLADPYLETLRCFGLQIGQNPAVLIEDNRETEDVILVTCLERYSSFPRRNA